MRLRRLIFALLIGTLGREGDLALTVTASTVRPVRIGFATMPDAAELRDAVLDGIPEELIHDDVHGKPLWRKQMTLRLAPDSVCGPCCATPGISASRRVATPATAAPAPCCSTASRCIAA